MTTPDTITLDAGWERCCDEQDVYYSSGEKQHLCESCGRLGKRREVVLWRSGEGGPAVYTNIHRYEKPVVTLRYGGSYNGSRQKGWWLSTSAAYVFLPREHFDGTPEQIAERINQSGLLAALLGIAEEEG